MISLDTGEIKLFGKYWGKDLVHNEDFWEDVYEYYSQEPRNAPMPLHYTPSTVRYVLDMLECPPGVCGECCHYKTIQLRGKDIPRIVENTEYTLEYLKGILKEKDGYYYIDGSNGCPFLKDNSCSIHKYRPDTCYLFPIGNKESAVKGEKVLQMTMRIRCVPVLKVARKLVTDSVTENKILLPDLSIIPRGNKC